MSMMLSCNKPNIKETDLFRLERQYKTGDLGQGNIVKDLEKTFTVYCNKYYASAYSSATSAFEAILKYLNIGPRDEVILSPLTFKSIPYSVIRSGAKPVFIDTNDSYLPDWSQLNQLITYKTKLIVTTSLYGLPDNNFKNINQNIWTCEDNSQSIGAKYKDGKNIGSSLNTDFSIFSFYATKNITGCEGGVIVHNQDTDFFDLYKNNGIVENIDNQIILGTNLRMTDINATLILSQFDRLDHITKHRNNQAKIYHNILNIENKQYKYISENTIHAFHQYTVELPENIDRISFVDSLKQKSIYLGIYYDYLTNYDYKLKRVIEFQETPNALDQSDRCVSLPIGMNLSHKDIEYIAKTFNTYLDRSINE